jgi:PIN domain nuclease of toxin-antitoxin system
MRVLLDTHIFIWWDSAPERLPPPLLALCQDRHNTLVLSVASVWEMQIKAQLGKLQFHRPIAVSVESQQRTNNLHVLSIEVAHVLALDALPFHHKDPFDRLLIAQANAEHLALMSLDTIFASYPVTLIDGASDASARAQE